MNLSADCMHCLIKRQMERLDPDAPEETKSEYMREVLRIVADAGEGISAPVVLADISLLRRRYFGPETGFEQLKRDYNALLLRREPEIAARIDGARDSLLAAIRFARAGNYIDFGAMAGIDDAKLDALLESAGGEAVDGAEYEAFRRDLAGARALTYLTDNCGEIVLDKLLIRVIQRLYPRVHITVVARGMPVLNDATMEDAAFVGMPAVAETIGNGAGIAGTHLPSLSGEARRRVLDADVIVSKGQGNFETLHGTGLNIYYLFLCKCDWFVRRFRMERHKGVFVSEQSCAI